MRLHSAIEYIKYRRKAIGRHGMHSPFVYKLVEEHLLKDDGRTLKQKLEDYFSGRKIQFLPARHIGDWRDTAMQRSADPERVVILEGIHQLPMHSQCWDELRSQEQVTLSLDIYEYGILLFSSDFKQKQHFVLKYIS